MDPSINQFQPAYDEEADPKAEALLKKAESSDETFFSFYHRHQQFDQQANGSMSEESNHRKINLLQESSNFSQQSKPKRRKTETVDELHKGRIVRSSGRKDRHSKVCTSRGPKDRRVRLSPGTAIQFYDVQDRLGYDRPSKAIDWLMKEAKSAIDALDAAENHSSVNGKTPQMQNNSENSISGFCDFDYELFPSPSTEFRAWPDGDLNPSRKRNQSLEDDFLSYPSYQDGVLTAFTYPSQIFDTNLQRIIANSEYSVMNTLPLQFTGPPVLGPNQIFTQREPLQSSFVNYCPIGNEFQGISFYGEEFSNVTPAETLKEKDKIPVVSSKHCFKYKED